MALEIEMFNSRLKMKKKLCEEAAKTQINKKCSPEQPISCSSEVLEGLTDNFKKEYFIGSTSFGKVYRGKLKLDSIGAETRDVTVKIWDEKVDVIDDGKVVDEEVKFLSHPSVKHHPNLVKLIGFCSEGPVNGVVYDLNPLDTLYNHNSKDNFSWIQRIKVALEFAKLLEFLHDGEWPYMVFNIDSANIMLDQACNPILIDFGLLSGGFMGGPRLAQEFAHMSIGYCDRYFARTGNRRLWCDVFSYGLILLGLIAKRIDLKENVGKYPYQLLDDWAYEVYRPQCSLVHTSLLEDKDYDASDGIELTELAMRCIQVDNPKERPTMSHVVKRLNSLRAVRLGGGDGLGTLRAVQLGGGYELGQECNQNALNVSSGLDVSSACI